MIRRRWKTLDNTTSHVRFPATVYRDRNSACLFTRILQQQQQQQPRLHLHQLHRHALRYSSLGWDFSSQLRLLWFHRILVQHQARWHGHPCLQLATLFDPQVQAKLSRWWAWRIRSHTCRPSILPTFSCAFFLSFGSSTSQRDNFFCFFVGAVVAPAGSPKASRRLVRPPAYAAAAASRGRPIAHHAGRVLHLL